MVVVDVWVIVCCLTGFGCYVFVACLVLVVCRSLLLLVGV